MRNMNMKSQPSRAASLASLLSLLSLLPFPSPAATWTGATSNPTNSCFAKGSSVEVSLAATGLAANAVQRLEIGVYDETDALVATVPGEVKADAAGAWKGTFAMPALDFGFYRVRPRVDGALVLPQQGSMPAGCLTFAVLHDPATRRLYPQDETFFGLHGHSADVAPWMGARVMLGYGNPPLPGQGIDYAKFREQYDAGQVAWKRYGLVNANLLHRLDNACYQTLLPPEARAFAKTNKNMWAWLETPERIRWVSTAWENLAKLAKAHDYGRAHGYVTRYYEVEWEPELTTAKREQIVQCAKVARAAILRGDPEAVIIGPTLSSIGRPALLKELFELGLADGLDAFCCHAYNQVPPEANDFVLNVRRTKALVREYMGPDAKLFGTENGDAETATTQNELDQMCNIVRQQLILLGEGFSFNLPFYAYDFESDGRGDYGFCYNLTMPKQVWGPPRVSPRPVFAGLSAASWFLEGHRPTCTIEWLGETVLGYAYQDRDGHCVVALWDWGGNKAHVEIPVGRTRVTVGDAMGKERAVAAPGGTLKLALSAAPQYVLDVDPAVWGREAQAKLKWSDRKYADAKAAAAPLHVTAARPAWTSNGLGVAVTVENATGEACGGTVETRILGRPEARREVAVSLKPHESREVAVAFDDFRTDPFALHRVLASVTPAAKGERHELEAALNFFPAPKRRPGAAPALHEIPACVALNPEYHAGADDLSAKMSVSWSEKFLFFAFEVEDDCFRQPFRGWKTWAGDSIQLGLAKERDVRGTANAYADDVARAFSEMTIAQTAAGPEVYRTMTWDDARFPAGDAPDGDKGLVSLADMPTKVTVERLDGGRARIRYAFAVPWRFVNVESPRPGTVVYFAATVNDTDEGDAAQSRIGVFELKKRVPKQFGAIVLGE